MLIGLALALFLVVSAEGFVHHHKHDATHDRSCAYCQWKHMGSQAVTNQVQPLLSPVYFILLLFFKKIEAIFSIRLFNSGRDPPQNLL